MTYRFIPCRTDSELERYSMFMLEHRYEIHSAFTAQRILHFFKEQFFHGQTFLVENDRGEVVAAAGYVNGTPENDFVDRETVRLEMVYIAPSYRRTRLFYHGIVWLADYMKQHAPFVNQIQFYAESEPEGRSRLFGKLADFIVTEPTKFGLEDEFLTSVERLLQGIPQRVLKGGDQNVQ